MADTIFAEMLARDYGYLTVSEAHELFYLANRIKRSSPVFVNIGAGSGTSSMAMREGSPNARIYSVDISPGGPLGGLAGELHSFTKYGMPPPIQLLGDSGEIGDKWLSILNEKINLLFIDDGHLKHEITRDIGCWYDHVYVGGIIAFHDYGSNDWPDVKEVVDYLMEGSLELVHVDTLIAFRKWAK